MSSNVKTFLFAFVMCVCCGLLLTVMSQGLKERQEENRRLDQQKNILKSLGLYSKSSGLVREEVMDLFSKSIQKYWVTPSGKLVTSPPKDGEGHPIFIYKKDNLLSGYAIPFSAYGLWSWIKGYIAFKNDGETVEGFTVYQHGETPGLGGECEKPWFQNNFIGKKILDSHGKFCSIGIVKGKVVDTISKPKDRINYVDGMSGATITSKGIQDGLKTTLEGYESFAKTLRRK